MQRCNVTFSRSASHQVTASLGTEMLFTQHQVVQLQLQKFFLLVAVRPCAKPRCDTRKKVRRLWASSPRQSTTHAMFQLQAIAMATAGVLTSRYLEYRQDARIASNTRSRMVVEGRTCRTVVGTGTFKVSRVGTFEVSEYICIQRFETGLASGTVKGTIPV